MRSGSLVLSSFCVLLGASACASDPAATKPVSPRSASLAPTATASRPSCEAIDTACDPHEREGGLASECHDFAETATTTEAACASRKAACLAVCPPK